MRRPPQRRFRPQLRLGQREALVAALLESREDSVDRRSCALSSATRTAPPPTPGSRRSRRHDAACYEDWHAEHFQPLLGYEPPGFVHASALRRISNLYFAVNVRRLARSTSSGSGTPAGAGAPAGPESQLSYGPLVFAAGGVISRSPSSIRACLQHPGVLRSRPQGS